MVCALPAGYLESDVKERPILFSAPMVRAMLSGSKIQTRRVVKPQPDFETARIALGGDTSKAWPVVANAGIGLQLPAKGNCRNIVGFVQPNQRCPHGQIGDRLWVRETFLNHSNHLGDICYRATHPDQDFFGSIHGGWKPSIFMPRAASRITLEITDVRVERLQDMSEADALAEGGYLNKCPCLPPPRDRSPINMAFRQTECHQHGTEFKHLWKSINGPGSWDLNPWVWAISFKVIT